MALVAVVVPASTANAAAILGHDDQTPMFQSWVDDAATLVPVPNVPIDVIQERCPPEIAPDAYWCMDPKGTPTRVWTSANTAYLWEYADLYSERDRLATRLTFLHEIGHVFDLAAPGPKGYRRAFVRGMGRRWTGWWWWPSEQFAMAYAFCAMYPHYEDAAYARTVWWGYNYKPSRARYERVCSVIRHASQYNRRGRLRRAPSAPRRG